MVIGDVSRRILSQSTQLLCFAVRLAQIVRPTRWMVPCRATNMQGDGYFFRFSLSFVIALLNSVVSR